MNSKKNTINRSTQVNSFCKRVYIHKTVCWQLIVVKQKRSIQDIQENNIKKLKPKEIKNRFPEAGSFSEKAPTYESMRKMIIMLFSYDFWYQVQWENEEFELDDYISQLNALLNDCGFSLIYYGNPYDWMFLYCTLSEMPLDTFRDIISEVLNEE